MLRRLVASRGAYAVALNPCAASLRRGAERAACRDPRDQFGGIARPRWAPSMLRLPYTAAFAEALEETSTLSWLWVLFYGMVEAVGVEPTSEKRVPAAYTCVAFAFESRRPRWRAKAPGVAASLALSRRSTRGSRDLLGPLKLRPARGHGPSLKRDVTS